MLPQTSQVLEVNSGDRQMVDFLGASFAGMSLRIAFNFLYLPSLVVWHGLAADSIVGVSKLYEKGNPLIT